MHTIKIENVNINELKPYEKNPRRNDNAVDKVAASIQEFGFKNPIIVDDNMEIIAGHTRYKAAKKLNIEIVPIIKASDLTPLQVKAYRLADNKTGEFAEWDMQLVNMELEDLIASDYDISVTGFDGLTEEQKEINEYTSKIEIPKYVPKTEKPSIEELVNKNKAFELIKKIEESNINEGVKEFLKLAAYRHLVFNYEDIAEFYSHSDKEVQELMEESALVIIDFGKAVENGFVDFTRNLLEGEEEGE